MSSLARHDRRLRGTRNWNSHPLSHHLYLARPGVCRHHALSARRVERTRISPAGPSPTSLALRPNFFSVAPSPSSRVPVPALAIAIAPASTEVRWTHWHLGSGHFSGLTVGSRACWTLSRALNLDLRSHLPSPTAALFSLPPRPSPSPSLDFTSQLVFASICKSQS